MLCSVGDCSTWHVLSDSVFSYRIDGGTLAAAPLSFRPGNPALCGSRPLVTPYYCRLGDMLCFVFMSAYCMFDFSVYYLFLQYFDTVGWVFWPVKNRLPYNLYCVGGDVQHCSIQSYRIDAMWYVQGCDLQGVKAYTGADVEGLYTLGTVVVDYRGYRVTAQSIIPGLLTNHPMFCIPVAVLVAFNGVQTKHLNMNLLGRNVWLIPYTLFTVCFSVVQETSCSWGYCWFG